MGSQPYDLMASLAVGSMGSGRDCGSFRHKTTGLRLTVIPVSGAVIHLRRCIDPDLPRSAGRTCSSWSLPRRWIIRSVFGLCGRSRGSWRWSGVPKPSLNSFMASTCARLGRTCPVRSVLAKASRACWGSSRCLRDRRHDRSQYPNQSDPEIHVKLPKEIPPHARPRKSVCPRTVLAGSAQSSNSGLYRTEAKVCR